jgi:hypothetical protein
VWLQIYAKKVMNYDIFSFRIKQKISCFVFAFAWCFNNFILRMPIETSVLLITLSSQDVSDATGFFKIPGSDLKHLHKHSPHLSKIKHFLPKKRYKFNTESWCRFGSNPASVPGGRGYQTWLGTLLPLLRISWSSSDLPGKYRDSRPTSN